jgi:hypothetical protein
MPRALIPQSMKQVLHLVTPQLALVLNIHFVGKIFDDQYRLVGHFGFFNSEFKEFIIRGMSPMKSDEFLKLAFQNFRLINGSIPRETEDIIPLVNFIGKPFLEAGRGP